MIDWKKYAVPAGIAVGAFAIGFGAGRFTAPAKVQIVEKTSQDKHTEVEAKTHTDAQKTQDSATKTNTHERKRVQRTTHEIVRADGTKDITKTTTVDTGLDQQQEQTSQKNVQVQVQQDVQAKQDEHVETQKATTILYQQPSLMITGLVGFRDITSLARGQDLIQHLENPDLVFGVVVQKRLFWNVWAGPFYMAPATVGAALSLQF